MRIHHVNLATIPFKMPFDFFFSIFDSFKLCRRYLHNRSPQKAFFSLYQVDVQTKHAQNEKLFNSTKRNLKRRRRRVIYYRYNNTRLSPADVKQNKRSRAYHRKIQTFSNYRVEMMPIFEIIQTLQTSRYNRSLKITSSKYNIFATSRLSRSASIRVHFEVPNG